MMTSLPRTRAFHVVSAMAGAVLAVVLLGASTALAQSSPDPAPADSVAAASHSPATPQLPIQALNADPSITLGHAPGVFSWTFDAAGWPNGLSAFGQDPNTVRLLWNGRSMDDLIVGRPRFDVVPIAILKSQSWDGQGGIVMTSDSLNMTAPVTRVRYESAGDGLQAVHALHVQNRYRATSDSTGYRLQTVFGYAGAAAQGEYDGSALRRGRQITARIGVAGADWSVWVQDVASRRAVGAHAGVVPFTGATYESIYQRLGATVSDPTARRRTIRNDLELGGALTRARWHGELRALRTSQTLDFRGNALETKGWATRWTTQARAGTNFDWGAVSVLGEVLRDGSFGGSAWTETPNARNQTNLQIDATVPGRGAATAGVTDSDLHQWWHASLNGELQQGVFSVHGWLKRSARRLTLLEAAGFSTLIGGLESSSTVPLQERQLARMEVGVDLGVIAFVLDVAHLRENDAIIHQLDLTHPGLESRVMSGTRSRSTGTVSVHWRDDGRKGLYSRVSATLQSATGPDGGSDALLWERSMPEQWASGRLGVKALLFQRDLDLDLYVRGRVWSEMNGLRLHTPTGLLVLPVDESEPIASSWLVDIGAEGGVRGATFFFAYENMFSGTTALLGNLIVPDYPLPRQRIRFGVYWPIAN